MNGLLAPWTDHGPELREVRQRMVALLNRLGRIEDELHELHSDMTALVEKVMKEKP